MNEEQKLQELFDHLPANNYLTAHEYISIDDSKVEHGLTDEEILVAIADEDKEEEESVDEQLDRTQIITININLLLQHQDPNGYVVQLLLVQQLKRLVQRQH